MEWTIVNDNAQVYKQAKLAELSMEAQFLNTHSKHYPNRTKRESPLHLFVPLFQLIYN